MATARPRSKTATETLLDRFSKLVESEATQMAEAELKAAEARFENVVSRVRASRARKRETA